MSQPYDETLNGESHLRPAPGERHEMVCRRLHTLVAASVDGLRSTVLLPPRSRVPLSRYSAVRPDLALVTTANRKLWLAVEIIYGGDHSLDTVYKKQIYEDIHLPRLWMVDTRYDNVEVYHASQFGLQLKHMLAGRDELSEKLLPEFQVTVRDLFAEQTELQRRIDTDSH